MEGRHGQDGRPHRELRQIIDATSVRYNTTYLCIDTCIGIGILYHPIYHLHVLYYSASMIVASCAERIFPGWWSSMTCRQGNITRPPTFFIRFLVVRTASISGAGVDKDSLASGYCGMPCQLRLVTHRLSYSYLRGFLSSTVSRESLQFYNVR
jgi:hypothetical protein